MSKPPAPLSDTQRADILTALAEGFALPVACKAYRARVEQVEALAAVDPAWAAAVREATLVGQSAPPALTPDEQAYILDSVARGGNAGAASRSRGVPGARWLAAAKEPAWQAALAGAEERARAGLRAVLPRAKEASDGGGDAGADDIGSNGAVVVHGADGCLVRSVVGGVEDAKEVRADPSARVQLAPCQAPTVAPALPPAAREAREAMAEHSKRGNEVAAVEILNDYSEDFVRVREAARDTYGPGRLGLLKWIDARGQMMRPALHPITPLWMGEIGNYYGSRKLIFLIRKGLRAGGSSTACPILVRCGLFAPSEMDAGTIGMIPIMSSSRDEADGRFVTIRSYLRAIGLTPPRKGKRGADEDFDNESPDDDGIYYTVPPGGIRGTFQSKRSASGGGIIAITDSLKQRIQFRILPALVKHGVGYTGRAGLADEPDLWPNDPEHHVNPAERILDRVSERFTTFFDNRREDPGAEMIISSASYHADSAHKRAVDEVLKAEARGADATPEELERIALTYLARLGDDGARVDEESRRRLAAVKGLTDPRLFAPADPRSPDLPTWAFNPAETIEKCYSFSKGNISRMLAKYGGRAAENAGVELCPLADVVFASDETAASYLDVVIGVAPPNAGANAWGIVAVALDGLRQGMLVVADASADLDGQQAARMIRGGAAFYRAQVIATATGQDKRVEAEIAAACAGTGTPVAAVAPIDVYDGGALRVGPLRTLYQRERLRHAPGLIALEAASRAWNLDAVRSPRLEALAVAVARLLACYPWLVPQTEQEPLRGPMAGGTLLERGADPREALRRAGAYVDRDDVL